MGSAIAVEPERTLTLSSFRLVMARFKSLVDTETRKAGHAPFR